MIGGSAATHFFERERGYGGGGRSGFAAAVGERRRVGGSSVYAQGLRRGRGGFDRKVAEWLLTRRTVRRGCISVGERCYDRNYDVKQV